MEKKKSNLLVLGKATKGSDKHRHFRTGDNCHLHWVGYKLYSHKTYFPHQNNFWTRREDNGE